MVAEEVDVGVDEVRVVEVLDEDVFVELVVLVTWVLVVVVVVVVVVVEEVVIVTFSWSHQRSILFGLMLETLSETVWPPTAC